MVYSMAHRISKNGADTIAILIAWPKDNSLLSFISNWYRIDRLETSIIGWYWFSYVGYLAGNPKFPKHVIILLTSYYIPKIASKRFLTNVVSFYSPRLFRNVHERIKLNY